MTKTHSMPCLITAVVAMCVNAALLSTSTLAQGAKKGGLPPALVRVGTVQRQQVIQRRLVIGSVRAVRRTTVASEESGRVTKAPPDPGTAVRAGVVLARLDDKLPRIRRHTVASSIKEAQAMVRQREAEMALVSRKHKRLVQLTPRGATTQKELDDARDMVTVAEARLQQATETVHYREAQLAEHDELLARMQVVAPFDGYVVRKSTELGQWLSPGDPVAQIIETTRVDAELDVPQFMVQHVSAGNEVEILVKALHLRRVGKVHRVVPDADIAARTFPILIRLDNRDGLLMPGMTVSAEIPSGQTINALTVPRDAVWTTPSGSLVFVNRGGTAAPVPVTVRFGTGVQFVVEGDLREGEQVVIEGNERLMPGQPLKLVYGEGQ